MAASPTPTPTTEAAGLLQSGVIFPRRVGLKPPGHPRDEAAILLGFKRGGFSIYVGDAPLLHFDLDGRWQRAFIAGTHYLKGLDTQARAVDRVREGDALVLRRRTLDPAEAGALDARIADQARALRLNLSLGRFELMPPPPPSRTIAAPDVGAMLDRIVGWDAAAWDGHRDRYRRAYGAGPAPFLPPDCPNPVILRADGRMTPADLAARARAVATLLGRRLDGCRDVFLTGPGWLDRPEGEVLALLAAVHEVFPIQPAQGRPRALDAGADAPRLELIHGWLDAPPAGRPAVATWARFRAAHLGRITLRVDLRAEIDRVALRDLSADLKAAGIGVGLAIFLPASDPFAAPLVEWVATLPLAAGDLIALIAAEEDDAALAPPAPPGPLAAIRAQITAALPSGAKGPRVVVYNPDKQWI